MASSLARYNTEMKTRGEIESAICQGMARFEQEYMGRGPKSIHAHLLGDLLLVGLQGVLMPPSSTWRQRCLLRGDATC